MVLGRKVWSATESVSSVNDFREVLSYFMIEYVRYAKLKCLHQCISNVIEVHSKERQFDI
jgi:hypothetical protein